MNILHVIPSMAAKYGGPTKAVGEMCAALRAKGHTARIYTTDRGGQPSADFDKTHIRSFRVAFDNPWGFSVGFYKSLESEIKNYDVVHIHSLYLFTTSCAAHLARKYGIPYVMMPHGALDPFLRRRHGPRKYLYMKLLEKKNLAGAAAIHYTAEEERKLVEPYLSSFGIKTKGAVIPLGVDLSDYAAPPRRGIFREKYNLRDKKILLFLGRINFKKGLDILLNALSKAARSVSNLHLVIAGPDDNTVPLDGLIKKEGVSDRVTLTGMLWGAEKMSAFVDADIFVLPSYTENFGISVIEAMASGLPVIVSNRINIYPDIAGGGAGIVTDCDGGQVSDAIIRLCGDSRLSEEMGSAGKRLVYEKYVWEKVSDQLIEGYEKIINRKTL